MSNFKLVEIMNKFYSSKRYLKDRNLSILEFNMRVFNQVYLDSVPLMEKANFIYIVFKNLDEFISLKLSDSKEKDKMWYIHTIENMYTKMSDALYKIVYESGLNHEPWENNIITGNKKLIDGGVYFVYKITKGEWGVVPYTGNGKLLLERIHMTIPDGKITNSFYIRMISEKNYSYIYTGESTNEVLAEIKDVIEIKKNGDFNFIQTTSASNSEMLEFLEYMGLINTQWIYIDELLLKCEFIIKKLKKDNPDPKLYYPPYIPKYQMLEYKQHLLQSDVLIHNPYGNYHMVLDFIAEMCLDKDITTIFISLYRMAKQSMIVKSLIAAKENGKNVYVYIEPTARGNEEENITVIEQLMSHGIHVSCNYFNYKVHAKIFCAIDKNGTIYTHIGTGNYNEDTAKVYTDYHLLTTNPNITLEVFRLFCALFRKTMYIPKNKNSLIAASPVNFRERIIGLINDESYKGEDGRIFLKCNSLCDAEIIDRLFSAAELGVKINIICRTGCSITAHPNITVKSKVGRFLEHDRVYIFGNRVFISSADLLLRNISKRVEILCEITDSKLKNNITRTLESMWNSGDIYILLENGRWDRSLDAVRHKDYK